MISFKDGFKRARKRSGLTQEQFANKYSFSLASIKKWEQGKATPEADTLVQLCEIFKCDMGYLFNQYDCLTYDFQFLQDNTGLTEQALIKLKKIYSENRKTGHSDIISLLLESPSAERFLALIGQSISYHAYSSGLDEVVEIDMGGQELMAKPRELIDCIVQTRIVQELPRIASTYWRNHLDSPAEKRIKYKDFIRQLKGKLQSGKINESEYLEIEQQWMRGEI